MCPFFLRVHVNGGWGGRALIEAERILVSSMQSSFALMSWLVFSATAGHLLLFGFFSVGIEDSHTVRCSSSSAARRSIPISYTGCFVGEDVFENTCLGPLD